METPNKIITYSLNCSLKRSNGFSGLMPEVPSLFQAHAAASTTLLLFFDSFID